MEELDPRLSALGPEARSRVEAELKKSIEMELASESEAAIIAEFSRGLLFSRVKPSLIGEEDALMNKAVQLEPEEFRRFAERLRTLKQKGEKS